MNCFHSNNVPDGGFSRAYMKYFLTKFVRIKSLITQADAISHMECLLKSRLKLTPDFGWDLASTSNPVADSYCKTLFTRFF